jgi:hypothetical protein
LILNKNTKSEQKKKPKKEKEKEKKKRKEKKEKRKRKFADQHGPGPYAPGCVGGARRGAKHVANGRQIGIPKNSGARDRKKTEAKIWHRW